MLFVALILAAKTVDKLTPQEMADIFQMTYQVYFL